MSKLKEYNGHYCESEYEYAFIQLLGLKIGITFLASR